MDFTVRRGRYRQIHTDCRTGANIIRRGLICFCIGADLPEIRIAEELIVDEPLFCVRTITLDQGTPVQVYAFESKAKFSVDKNALKTLALDAGPWLNQLKQLIGEGDNQAMIRLPDNSSREAGELGARLLIVTPGEKLVYATDLADTAANRAALIALAHKSDIFSARLLFWKPISSRPEGPAI